MAPDGLREIERSLISKRLEPFAQISAFPHSSSENPMISGLSNFIRISFGKKNLPQFLQIYLVMVSVANRSKEKIFVRVNR